MIPALNHMVKTVKSVKIFLPTRRFLESAYAIVVEKAMFTSTPPKV